jgi:hypothetical protein
MLGTDLRRMWWGAWGDPRGFVPRMADYFKLCNIDKPATPPSSISSASRWSRPPWARGSRCGAARSSPAGTSRTRTRGPRWSRCSARTRPSSSSRSGSRITSVERIERFSQAIGEGAFSELELGRSLATPSMEQVERLCGLRSLHRGAARSTSSAATCAADARRGAGGAHPRRQGGDAGGMRAGAVARSGGAAEHRRRTASSRALERVCNAMTSEGSCRVRRGPASAPASTCTSSPRRAKHARRTATPAPAEPNKSQLTRASAVVRFAKRARDATRSAPARHRRRAAARSARSIATGPRARRPAPQQDRERGAAAPPGDRRHHAIAEDSRSQHENRRIAVKRLRAHLALRHREAIDLRLRAVARGWPRSWPAAPRGSARRPGRPRSSGWRWPSCST